MWNIMQFVCSVFHFLSTMVMPILTMAGGNTKFYIQGTTVADKIVQLACGKVDDIRFPSVPYRKYKVQHVSVAKTTT